MRTKNGPVTTDLTAGSCSSAIRPVLAEKTHDAQRLSKNDFLFRAKCRSQYRTRDRRRLLFRHEAIKTTLEYTHALIIYYVFYRARLTNVACNVRTAGKLFNVVAKFLYPFRMSVGGRECVCVRGTHVFHITLLCICAGDSFFSLSVAIANDAAWGDWQRRRRRRRRP